MEKTLSTPPMIRSNRIISGSPYVSIGLDAYHRPYHPDVISQWPIRIRSVRKKMVLSQEKLGVLLGACNGTIRQWESGERGESLSYVRHISFLEAIVKLYGGKESALHLGSRHITDHIYGCIHCRPVFFAILRAQ